MADNKGTPDPLAEIVQTQVELKATIKESERLIDKTQTLLKKHRKEMDGEGG